MSVPEPLVIDIEAKGLLPDLKNASSFLCAVTKGLITNEVKYYRLHDLMDFIDALFQASCIIAHNGLFYDIPALERMTGRNLSRIRCIDTLLLSRLVYPDTHGLSNREGFPPKLRGSHSLKAWGYRLGEHKSDKFEGYDWVNAVFTEDMLQYCEQDVQLTTVLFKVLMDEKPSEAAVELEHTFAKVMSQQVRNGFVFDTRKAQALYSELKGEREILEKEIHSLTKGWYAFLGTRIPTKTLNYKDKYRASITQAAVYSVIKWIEFNPSSRDHIAKILKDKGWVATVFTPSGKPQMDEETLSSLTFREGKLFARWFLLQKRLGQLAEGKQAWLKLVRDGRIYGSINTNGAVTGRCTHSRPNIAQVPTTKAEYGTACRELFTVPPDWFLLGADASGLELRCLAHYMAAYDGGKYARIILSGDIHIANMEAAGLPTREDAKTFIYAFLYGAGDLTIGRIIGKGRRAGKRIKAQFFAALPALKQLIEDTQKRAEEDGYLLGLDGRIIQVRSVHAALNTLLQSAGALICKQWTVNIEQIATRNCLLHSWTGDYAFCANIHDEVQIACVDKGTARFMGDICKEAMQRTEEHFNFKCPLAIEYKVGKTWAEVH